ncbi:MAG: glycoside hydrolase family 88 protein [Verrucomicrobiota bacterium]
MKNILIMLRMALLGGVFLHCASAGESAQSAPALSQDPQAILSLMHSVADWQLAVKLPESQLTNWIQGAGYTGFMALSRLPGGKKYEEAMVKIGEKTQWKLGPQCRFHADDMCVGQMYLDLYARLRKPEMIADTRQVMDEFAALKDEGADKPMTHGIAVRHWTWCDALFMAPAVLAKLYTLTGDVKYHDTLMREYKRTTDFLYNREEQLYYRDSSFFNKREVNGRKVFWGRGNGWVFGGLANVLGSLPKDAPGRPYFETIFKQMASRIIATQQPDGLWRASLLDPDSFPLKETSGSGLFCYGLAWGINNGLLDRATTLPTVERAWAALSACVNPEGKLTHVQPVGADPKSFKPESTEAYGVGAFLLAGTEIYRLIQPAVHAGDKAVIVTVKNPLLMARASETVEIPWAAAAATVMEDSTPIPSQIFEGKLLFQSDFGPGQSKTFAVSSAPGPQFPVKAYGRYVPERSDDYAWENDRIAFRIYGPALEKAKSGAMVSSGVDVWVKRVRGLVIDKRYKAGNYHTDVGDGLDNYSCGSYRGCGGIGIWAGNKLHVSRNWATQKTLAIGPVRTAVELTYAPWDCGNGVTVAETRRIILDAGSNLNRFESRFIITGTNVVSVAVGLDVSKNRQHDGVITGGAAKGYFANWEPELKPNGSAATAILIAKGSPAEGKDPDHVLLMAPVKDGDPFIWYAGAGWSKSGDFADAAAWTAYVDQFAARARAPLMIAFAQQ